MTETSVTEIKVRDSNIELLRIIMMLVIIIHHYVVNSGVIQLVNALALNGGGSFH